MSLPLSRSSVLKVTEKVFDPMGFFMPFMISMKILFPELIETRSTGMTGYRENF